MKNTWYYLSICYYKLTYLLIKICWNPYKFILNLNLLLFTITCLLYIFWMLNELDIVYVSSETINYVDELDFSNIENTEVLEIQVKYNKNTNNIIKVLKFSNYRTIGFIVKRNAFYKNNKLLDYVKLSVPPQVKGKLIFISWLFSQSSGSLFPFYFIYLF